MSIRFLDMFAGIGGFRSGLEAIGGFECVGHCEIDKYADQAYNYSGIKKCYVLKPGASSYVEYTRGSQLTDEGTLSLTWEQ